MGTDVEYNTISSRRISSRTCSEPSQEPNQRLRTRGSWVQVLPGAQNSRAWQRNPSPPSRCGTFPYARAGCRRRVAGSEYRSGREADSPVGVADPHRHSHNDRPSNIRFLFIGSQFRSTLPSHARSPSPSCVSLRSLWSAYGRTPPPGSRSCWAHMKNKPRGWPDGLFRHATSACTAEKRP
jgi:hypothetical protein